MNKNAKILLVLVAVLVVGAVIGYPMIKKDNITKDPVKHIMYSFGQNYGGVNVNASADMSFEVDKAKALELKVFDTSSQEPEKFADFVNALVSKAHMKYDVNMIGEEKDLSTLDFEEDIYITYGDNTVLEFDMNLKPWSITLQSPQLHEKAFKFDLNDMLKLSLGSDVNMDDFDIQKYMEIFTKEDELTAAVEKNYKPYLDVVSSFLEGKIETLPKSDLKLNLYGKEKTVNVYNYKINANVIDIYKVYGEILEVAKTDENAKKLIIARANELYEIAKDDEFLKALGATDSDFEEMLTAIKDMETNYEAGIDTIIEQFNTITEDPEINKVLGSSNMVVSIDKEHKVRGLTMDMASGFINIKYDIRYNGYGDEVKPVDKFADKEMVDLLPIIQNPESVEAQTLVQELMTNGITEIVSGKSLEAILADVEVEAKNHLSQEEADQLIAQLGMFKAQLPMFINYMTGGMGM